MIVSNKELLFLFFILLLLFSACRSSEPGLFEGYDYDPEGVTETHDRKITHQHKRTVVFLSDGIWISNEFEGARVSDVYKIEPFRYRIEITPEITPINNSPWYAFKIWGDHPADVEIELFYEAGRQRYIPKISRDNRVTWSVASENEYVHDRSSNIGRLNLSVTEEKTYIAAQELFTSEHFDNWLFQITKNPFAESHTIGYSHENRELKKLLISETDGASERGVIIIYGRQHPPEIPGYKLSLFFLETLAGNSDLAKEFRHYFDIWAFPFINPDGVDNGHWRSNAAGVDLNRDWNYFRQPETAAIRNRLMDLLEIQDRKVFYGIDFHSTGRNIFYPIRSSNPAITDRFTYRWAEKIRTEIPELSLGIRSFDPESPIAKNWTYKTFNADAVTFEVWDEIPRNQLELFGVRSAEIFMEMMLNEYHSFF